MKTHQKGDQTPKRQRKIFLKSQKITDRLDSERYKAHEKKT